MEVYEGVLKYVEVYKVYLDILNKSCGREGKGREGKEREGKEREGKGREGRGREGRGGRAAKRSKGN